ncbi:WSC domain-containing protein 1 isoform X2 [Strongylocentrotus purpuratus]|uniref:Sulfotransferase domain-containing protein n=1 Tax=Strongylocentrotus purpuratus TaxID=7668 RepID=A0A7M7NHQ0_STRPU|nr:WSC domain-containing protein 1 isoform X2 [Strongylocentrotus purpuratus]
MFIRQQKIVLRITMGYDWNKMFTLLLILLLGLTAYYISSISEDGVRSRVRHLGDRPTPFRIEPDQIITRNTTTNAMETGLVFCNDTRLMPKGTFPPISLASFPGSGNTWVRHLIETATGYATGSVYTSPILSSRGFIGEMQPALSGRALTIKTHMFNENTVGAILLVRNPYRAMISEYNRQKAGKTGHAREKTFKTAEWRKYVRGNSRRWLGLYRAFISKCHHSGNTCKSTLIVYYEQLQLHLKDELRRILEYLNITIDEERLACAVTNAEGQFHRPKRNTTFDPFSKEDRSLVDISLNLYRDLIDLEGLEEPPSSLSSYPSDL